MLFKGAQYLLITSRYPVEYPRSFVLGGKKIFRSGEGKGIRGGKGKKTGLKEKKKRRNGKKKKKRN